MTGRSVRRGGGCGETLLHQAIEGAEIFCCAQSEAAVDLHGGPEAGAGDIERGDGGSGVTYLFAAAGIGSEEPDAVPSAAQDLSEVAAPKTGLEVEIDGGLAIEQALERIDG